MWTKEAGWEIGEYSFALCSWPHDLLVGIEEKQASESVYNFIQWS